jgi:hypothetical protein
MPDDPQELHSTSDALIAVPHSWRRVFAIVGKSGLLALFFAAAGVLQLIEIIRHPAANDRRWLWLAAFCGFAFALALIHLWILRASLRRPLSVFADGIELGASKVPWEKVASCQWAPHAPGILQIRLGTHVGSRRLFVFVPEQSRPGVEAVFRRFGKWDAGAAA